MSATYDKLLGKVLMHKHKGADISSVALLLDQTAPQTVDNGSPVFAQGLTIKANQRVYLDG